MSQSMIQYVRRNNGRRRGALVAVVTGPFTYGVGWSLCNETAGDKFDQRHAVLAATERAVKGTAAEAADVPQSVKDDLRAFRSRARRYFRDKVENTSEIAKNFINMA